MYVSVGGAALIFSSFMNASELAQWLRQKINDPVYNDDVNKLESMRSYINLVCQLAYII